MLNMVDERLSQVAMAPDLHSSSKRPLDEDQTTTTNALQKKPKVGLKRKECTICSTDVAVNWFPKLAHEGAEEHDRGVCFACWEQHLASEVVNKAFDAVSCPQCDDRLIHEEIKKLAAKKKYHQ